MYACPVAFYGNGLSCPGVHAECRIFSEKRQTGSTLPVGIARNCQGFYDSESRLMCRMALPVSGKASPA